jgi:hypothetical protein
MKHRTILQGLGVAVLVAVLLAMGSRSPESTQAAPAAPQPVTMSWDGVICIGPVASLPTLCTPVGGNPTFVDAGTAGTLDIGDNPEQVSIVMLDATAADNPGGAPNEPFFAKAIQTWNGGIIAHPGGTITDGDQIGVIQFSLESNVTSPLSNNIDLADGQPPSRTISANIPPHINTSFPYYDSALAFSPTVSQNDGSDAGTTPDTRDDNKGANCSAGADGLMDGIDCMPSPLPAFIVSYGFPPHTFISRGFGLAPVFPGLGAYTDVHFLVFDLRVMQDPLVDFVTQAVVGYPGVPSGLPTANNVTDQSVDTHPPFLVLVRNFGVTVGNAAHLPNPIPGGVASRTVYEDGTFNYDLAMFPNSDYDGDGLPNLYDNCDIDDTPPAGPAGDTDADDTDRDALTGVCDLLEDTGPKTPGNSAGPTDPANYATVPPWDDGQDPDHDGFINYQDNCPNKANGSGSDIQKDTDEDGVGDACDSDPLVPGRGAGGEISDGQGRDATSCSDSTDNDGDGLTDGADPDCTGGYAGGFQDADNTCRDQYTIPAVDAGNGAEPAEEPGAAGSKECLSAYTVATAHPDYPLYSNPAMYHVLKGSTAYDLASGYNDSDDDGQPDWLPAVTAAGYNDKDTDSDSDFDGHSDACEGAMGSDPLDPSSVPGGAAVPGTPGVGGNCDGGTEADTSEGLAGRDITNAADDVGGLDTDGDGCADDQEEGAMGGYDPTNGQDYYDVPVPANADPTPNGTKNKAVNLSDVLAILLYVPSSAGGPTNINGVDYDSDKNADTQADGVDYDRSPSPAPNPPYDAGPPNGAINLSDVLAALAQVPKSCSNPGMTKVDINVSQVRLTKNGTEQAPGSTVDYSIAAGDLLDVKVTEHADFVPSNPGQPILVNELVYVTNPPTGVYTCVNDLAAISKDPTATKVTWKGGTRVKQYCTVGHIFVPGGVAGQTWLESIPLIDAEVTWQLVSSTTYTKTVNLIEFGTPGARMFDGVPVVGAYPVSVCAREDPHDADNVADTNTANNFKCESYTINIVP